MERLPVVSRASGGFAGRRRRPRGDIRLERLESRALMAADVSVAGSASVTSGDRVAELWNSARLSVYGSAYFTYTLTVANHGDGDSGPIVLSEQLDPRLVFVRARIDDIYDVPLTLDPAANLLTADLPSIPAGGRTTLVVRTEVPAATLESSPAPYVGSYSIATVDENVNPQTGGAFQNDSPGPVADLAVTISGPTVPAGGPARSRTDLVYTIVATNLSPVGTAPGAAVQVRPLGDLYTWQQYERLGFSPDRNPGWDVVSEGDTGWWGFPPIPTTPSDVGLEFRLGDLAPGESRTLTLVIHPSMAVAAWPSAMIRAMAYGDIDGDGVYDTDVADNWVDSSTPLAADASIEVVSVTPPTPTRAGDDLAYTVMIRNDGFDPATGVVVRQTLPAGTTFASAAFDGRPVTGSVADGVLSIVLPTVYPGSRKISVVLGTAGVVVPSPSTLTATFDAMWNEWPGVAPAVERALGPVTPAESLSISMAATPDLYPSMDYIYANSSLNYTYTVTNHRAVDARDVTIALSFPPASRMVLAPGDYTLQQTADGQVAVFRLGTLAAGASWTASVLAVALAPAVGVVHVAGTLDEADRPPGDYPELSVDTAVRPRAEISVRAIPAGPGVFKFVVTNHGPSPATHVIVQADNKTANIWTALRDGVPINITGERHGDMMGGGLAVYPPYAIWTGDLAVGESTVFEIASSDVANSYAWVDGQGADLTPHDNWTYTRPESDPRPAGVVAHLSADVATVATGGYATFTALATNLGPFAGRGVVIVAAIPWGSRLVSTSPGVVVQGDRLYFTIDELPVGAIGGFQFVVSPTWDAVAGGLVTAASIVPTEQLRTPSGARPATATVAVVAGPSGSAEAGSASYEVDEGAGLLTVVVNRVGGSSGPLSVAYATADGTAIAGVDYVATSGTLDFADGETVKTIVVPILPNPASDEGHWFRVYVAGGTSTLATIRNTTIPPPPPPPTVAAMQIQGRARVVSAISLRLTGPLPPSTALDPASYRLVGAGRDRRFGTRDDVRVAVSASYDPSTATVTLFPARRIPAGRFFRLTASGLGAEFSTPLLRRPPAPPTRRIPAR